MRRQRLAMLKTVLVRSVTSIMPRLVTVFSSFGTDCDLVQSIKIDIANQHQLLKIPNIAPFFSLDFRLNKFCDERLRIDNEPEPTLLPSVQPESRGEPVAEARVQTDQSFHHLKILKSGGSFDVDNNDVIDPYVGNTNNKTTADRSEAQNVNTKRRRPKQQQQLQQLPQQQQSRVYSQDFRFFKIIPSHDHVNRSDAVIATNEIYRKDDPQLAATIAPATDYLTERTPVTSSSSSTTTTTTINPIHHVIPTMTTTTTATKNTKDIDSRVTTNSQLDVIPGDVEEIFTNEIAAESFNYGNNEPYFDASTTAHPQPSTTPTTSTTINTPNNPTTERTPTYEQYDDGEDDDDDKSYEDYAIETFGRTVVRKNKARIHTSYQLPTYTGLPLRQGFLATTGYPKYYIGESNCSWTLSAPHGHRVRLTVLDLNLRSKCTHRAEQIRFSL